MPRQYIDPREFLDKIALLEKKIGELTAELESAKRAALAETPLIIEGLEGEAKKDDSPAAPVDPPVDPPADPPAAHGPGSGDPLPPPAEEGEQS